MLAQVVVELVANPTAVRLFGTLIRAIPLHVVVLNLSSPPFCCRRGGLGRAPGLFGCWHRHRFLSRTGSPARTGRASITAGSSITSRYCRSRRLVAVRVYTC